MNKAIVIAWIDPQGDIKDSGKLTFDGANYFPVIERCEKRFALIYSRDITKERKLQAGLFAEEKRQEYSNVKVFVLDDTSDILEIAKKKL